jgi:hypothetical protein
MNERERDLSEEEQTIGVTIQMPLPLWNWLEFCTREGLIKKPEESILFDVADAEKNYIEDICFNDKTVDIGKVLKEIPGLRACVESMIGDHVPSPWLWRMKPEFEDLA